MTRRRRAPHARETSDVKRFRGIFLAALLAFTAVLLAIVVGRGGHALVSPGPLAQPHRDRGLACAACHQAEAKVAGCTSCHGPHRSARPAHERLRSLGKLDCGTCHAVHRAEEGLAFSPAGRVIFFGSGFERELALPELAFRPTQTTRVPLIRAEACAKCHDLGNRRDPAAICSSPKERAGGFALCFDEHGGEAQALRRNEPGRTAAIEAARQVLLTAPPKPWTLAGLGSLSPIFVGLSVAVLVLVARRRKLSEWIPTRLRSHEPGAGKAEPPTRRLPVIDAATCLGCSACVDVCPYDVFEIKNYVAVVARPDDCCGLVSCQERCPNGSLVVHAGTPPADAPRLDEGFQLLETPGLYLAGDVAGLPLIRSAVEQGSRAAHAIARSLRGAPKVPSEVDADVIVIGAGPAGLATALECRKLGLSVIVLEQGKVAESIQNFPRGKLILDEPVADAERLPLWLGDCTKEELVAKWLRIVRRARLDVREGRRVTDVSSAGRHAPATQFVVSAVAGESEQRYRGRRVVLAIGRRGTPRKLDVAVPTSMQNRVHYALRDTQSFRGQRLFIVGLGDSAMEAALALAHQPDTEVVVSYRGSDFRRGKARNIEALRRLVALGKVEVVFQSEVESIAHGEVTLTTAGGVRKVACEAVFVLIGSMASRELLDRVGA